MKGLVNQGLRITVENLSTSLACDGLIKDIQAIMSINGIDDIWSADDADLAEAYSALLVLESNY